MSISQYSLDQVRNHLATRRAELVNRSRRVARDLERRNESLVADSSDQAIQLQNDETLEVIGEAATVEIRAIDEALEQLNLGRYGACKDCGESIPVERLRAIPYAVRCANCARATRTSADRACADESNS